MKLDYEKGHGLVSAVIQDATSGRVLMLGWMNEEAFHRTLGTREVAFYSRSRKKLWIKGETSGHKLLVKDVFVDCDRDSVLVTVDPVGPGVCHEGFESCFFTRFKEGGWVVNEVQTFDPEAAYAS